ncbi:hypothetical protein CYLTODRAFT_486082 [Cylindrobasidium torrendii FP15055 ss-10]|uniref:Nuclear protein DGCR14 n=1 Tax=Cylindrobasidium torrendii FP15055 ss-10 TaxID=1314674 RepID=A0A0D7BRQ7_9AGAR|nr:hypothetical protein CYLTODRAFT_486082 [Cylindrobasidium torrendii FP15055 ss-10]
MATNKSSLIASSDTPAPARSLNSQIVLEEDEYTAALSHIIARDFFPSLVHLDATNDYLDALKTADPALIGASVRRMEQLGDTDATPFGFGRTPYDTPTATPLHGEPPRKKAKFDDSLRLDTFQARYTSEDNSSFTDILESENQARKETWGWAWEAQRKAAEKQKLIGEARERLLLEGPSGSTTRPGVKEKFLLEPPEKPTIAGLIEDRGERQNEVGQAEEVSEKEKAVALVVQQEQDVMAPPPPPRHNGMDNWNFKTRNSLYFSPSADESPYYKHRPSEGRPEDLKHMNHVNTRLPEQDDDASGSHSLSEPPSPTRSRINAAIQGTPYRPHSPQGFKLVPDLPSPSAADLPPKAIKLLSTWGQLNATPRIISQTDVAGEPNTPFRIAGMSRREQISHNLSNKASKSLKARADLLGLNRTPGTTPRRGSMPPPSMTPRKRQAAGNLTPAAKRLLDRTTMGTLASRRADAMEKSSGWASSQTRETDLKQVRWTPTPGMSGMR